MSTRCLIGKKNQDKTITYIYCHFDGYPSYVGNVLRNHYSEEENVDRLLALGDIASLGMNPVAAKDFDDSDDNTCHPYSLRGEECPATTVKTQKEYLAQDRWQEYFYLFKNGKWYWSEGNPFRELTQAACNRD